ncbi:ATP-binding protein [Lujinxingia litoralis]|nr:AAA family ATPase [Lujinxingia litoralis]
MSSSGTWKKLTRRAARLRQEEQRTLGTLLDAPGARVAIYGPPGVGKSHLAREVAEAWAEARSPGAVQEASVAWVDARSALPGESFFDTLALALGLGPISEFERERAVDLIAEALGERGATLVIFDDADRVAADLYPLLERVEALDELRILLTSRVVLGDKGVRSYTLSPLSREDARALFITTARQARPVFDPSRVDAGALDALLAHLDDLPLAIVLAAARLTILSVESLLQRLEKRFQILRPAHGGEDRSRQALGEAIGLSWELLDEVERATLAQCAVFSGDFDLEAAEAVIETGREDAWVGDVLQSLVLKSLVNTALSDEGEELRFSVLESVAQYAAAESAPMLIEAARRRHANHYAERAGQLDLEVRGPEGERALKRLLANTSNLSVAAERLRLSEPKRARELLFCMHPTFEVRGLLGAYLERIESIGREHPEVPDSARGALIRAAILRSAGRLDAAFEAVDEAERLFESAEGDASPRAPSRSELLLEKGRVLADLGRMEEAAQAWHQGADAGSSPFVAMQLNNELGRYAINRARLGLAAPDEDAEALFERGLQRLRSSYEAARSVTHVFFRLRISLGWAMALHEQDNTLAGMAVLREEIEALRERDYRTHELSALHHLSLLAYYAGDIREAIAISAESDRGFAEMGLGMQRARNASARTVYLMAAARPEEARDVVAQAVELCDAHHQSFSALVADAQGLLCAWEVGDHELLAIHLPRVQKRLRELHSPGHEAIAAAYDVFAKLHGVGGTLTLHEARTRVDEAVERLSQTGELRRPVEAPRWEAVGRAWRAMVELCAAGEHLEAGRWPEVYDALDEVEGVRLRQADTSITVPLRHAQQLAAEVKRRYALPAQRPTHLLRVQEQGRRVQLNEDAPIDLSSRSPLRRVLLALIERARSGMPSADMEAVVAAGWPGEQIEAKSAANRVYSTVRMLRNQGLDPVIVTDEVGYRIAEGVLIVG